LISGAPSPQGAAGDASPFPSVPAESGPRLRSRVRLLGLRLAGRVYRYTQHTVLRPAPSAAPRSILLIRPDHLGDALFLTPALHALRTALPEAQITLLVGPWSRAVFAGNRDVDRIDICAFPGFERRPKGNSLAARPYELLFKAAKALRTHDYDTAVVLRFDHWWGAWLATAAGIPRRVGYGRPETIPFLTEAHTYLPERHEVQQNASLLTRLAPEASRQLGLTRYDVGDEDRVWALAWLAERGVGPGQTLVAIHPGAGATVKQWPVAAWAEVARGISDAHRARILFTGSDSERALADSLVNALAQPAINAAGETTLGRLAAIQERCALVLGSDSGPLHLAVAVGTPTVHLFGPVAASRFGPWGDPSRHVVVSANWPCVPCNRLDWPARVLQKHACMSSITPEQVLVAAQPALAAG
jgi:ADP-heptose:LPS heptosyltransferase